MPGVPALRNVEHALACCGLVQLILHSCFLFVPMHVDHILTKHLQNNFQTKKLEELQHKTKPRGLNVFL